MSRGTKLWLALGASLVIVGLVVFCAVMGGLNWNFKALSTNGYETNSYPVREDFDNISIRLHTADVRFVLSDTGSARVECYEEAKVKHTVSVEGDTLVIAAENRKAWYDYIGIHFGSPRVTVYLPRAEYAELVLEGSTGAVELPKAFRFASADISLSTGAVDCYAAVSGLLRIETSTGDISLEHTDVGALELRVSTGEVEISDVICQGDVTVKVTTGETELEDLTCRNLTSTGSTGSVSLERVTVAEQLTVERSTGDVEFERSDAGQITVKTDTGDVRGSLRSEKVFIVHTDTGRVSVPGTTSGGRCEITTDTGDIRLEIE